MGVAWPDHLRPRLHGRVVIVALGDPTAGDDAAGPVLISLLRDKPGLVLLDCGAYPQNFLGTIARASPDVVMLVDAAEFGGKPGEIRILDRGSIGDWGISSHGLPLGLLMEQVELITGAPVFLLGIQIAGLEHKAALHPDLAATVRELASFLAEHATQSCREHAG